VDIGRNNNPTSDDDRSSRLKKGVRRHRPRIDAARPRSNRSVSPTPTSALELGGGGGGGRLATMKLNSETASLVGRTYVRTHFFLWSGFCTTYHGKGGLGATQGGLVLWGLTWPAPQGILNERLVLIWANQSASRGAGCSSCPAAVLICPPSALEVSLNLAAFLPPSGGAACLGAAGQDRTTKAARFGHNPLHHTLFAPQGLDISTRGGSPMCVVGLRGGTTIGPRRRRATRLPGSAAPQPFQGTAESTISSPLKPINDWRPRHATQSEGRGPERGPFRRRCRIGPLHSGLARSSNQNVPRTPTQITGSSGGGVTTRACAFGHASADGGSGSSRQQQAAAADCTSGRRTRQYAPSPPALWFCVRQSAAGGCREVEATVI
jgi:hypothetical protein